MKALEYRNDSDTDDRERFVATALNTGRFALRAMLPVNINAPQGRIPCAIFTKFAEFVPHFRIALGVKILLDLLKVLWSYGGFKLRGSACPQIFSAP